MANPACPVCGAPVESGEVQTITRRGPGAFAPDRHEPGQVAYRGTNGHYHDGERETGPVPEDIVVDLRGAPIR